MEEYIFTDMLAEESFNRYIDILNQLSEEALVKHRNGLTQVLYPDNLC